MTVSTITTYKYSITAYLGLIALFEFLDMPQLQADILTYLMLIDFISGIAKQARINYKEITSYKVWIGIMKKSFTFVMILSIGLVFKAMEIDGDGVIKAVMTILIGAEGYSILRNIYTIRTGKYMKEVDVVTLLIRALGDFILKYLQRYIAKNLEPVQEEEKKPENTTNS